MSKETQDVQVKKSRRCPCENYDRPCYECEYNRIQSTRKPRLASDCIVVDSLICNNKESIIAEISLPLATLGGLIDIGPGGVISPAITLVPDISNIVSQTTVAKNLIIITGYLPANVSILGIETPIQIGIPFQHEVKCSGVCPEDNVRLTPFKIESIVTQGIEALGVVVANVLFKVILSTNITATRPVIAKANDLRVVSDVNVERCGQCDYNG